MSPRILNPDARFPTMREYFKWAKITEMKPEDCADISIVSADFEELDPPEIYEDVPIYYHCEPDARELDNGALEGGSAAFEVDLIAIVEFLDEEPRIVARYDGLKTCQQDSFVLFVGSRFAPFSSTQFIYNPATEKWKKVEYSPSGSEGYFPYYPNYFNVSIPDDMNAGLLWLSFRYIGVHGRETVGLRAVYNRSNNPEICNFSATLFAGKASNKFPVFSKFYRDPMHPTRYYRIYNAFHFSGDMRIRKDTFIFDPQGKRFSKYTRSLTSYTSDSQIMTEWLNSFIFGYWPSTITKILNGVVTIEHNFPSEWGSTILNPVAGKFEHLQLSQNATIVITENFFEPISYDKWRRTETVSCLESPSIQPVEQTFQHSRYDFSHFSGTYIPDYGVYRGDTESGLSVFAFGDKIDFSKVTFLPGFPLESSCLYPLPIFRFGENNETANNQRSYSNFDWTNFNNCVGWLDNSAASGEGSNVSSVLRQNKLPDLFNLFDFDSQASGTSLMWFGNPGPPPECYGLCNICGFATIDHITIKTIPLMLSFARAGKFLLVVCIQEKVRVEEDGPTEILEPPHLKVLFTTQITEGTGEEIVYSWDDWSNITTDFKNSFYDQMGFHIPEDESLLGMFCYSSGPLQGVS